MKFMSCVTFAHLYDFIIESKYVKRKRMHLWEIKMNNEHRKKFWRIDMSYKAL